MVKNPCIEMYRTHPKQSLEEMFVGLFVYVYMCVYVLHRKKGIQLKNFSLCLSFWKSVNWTQNIGRF